MEERVLKVSAEVDIGEIPGSSYGSGRSGKYEAVYEKFEGLGVGKAFRLGPWETGKEASQACTAMRGKVMKMGGRVQKRGLCIWISRPEA